MSAAARKAASAAPYSFGVVRMVLLRLADLANEKHEYEVWARQSEIAADLRCSRQAVNMAFAQLVTDGWLERTQRQPRGGANHYRLSLRGVTPSHTTGVNTADTGGVNRDDTGQEGRCQQGRHVVSTGTTRGVRSELTPIEGKEPNRTNFPAQAPEEKSSSFKTRGSDRGNEATEEALLDELVDLAYAHTPEPTAKRATVRRLIAEAIAAGHAEDDLRGVIAAGVGVWTRPGLAYALDVRAHPSEPTEPRRLDYGTVPSDATAGRVQL